MPCAPFISLKIKQDKKVTETEKFQSGKGCLQHSVPGKKDAIQYLYFLNATLFIQIPT